MKIKIDKDNYKLVVNLNHKIMKPVLLHASNNYPDKILHVSLTL